MKSLAKISSQLISEDQTIDLKLKKQHYIMITPKDLIQHLGIVSDEINFELVINNSNKITLIGPKLGSQPKSAISTSEREGFVI